MESENDLVEGIDNEIPYLLTGEEVDELINRVPPSLKNIANLYMYFHLTAPEIVAITKESRDQVHRSITMIKQFLEDNFV